MFQVRVRIFLGKTFFFRFVQVSGLYDQFFQMGVKKFLIWKISFLGRNLSFGGLGQAGVRDESISHYWGLFVIKWWICLRQQWQTTESDVSICWLCNFQVCHKKEITCIYCAVLRSIDKSEYLLQLLKSSGANTCSFNERDTDIKKTEIIKTILKCVCVCVCVCVCGGGGVRGSKVCVIAF